MHKFRFSLQIFRKRGQNLWYVWMQAAASATTHPTSQCIITDCSFRRNKNIKSNVPCCFLHIGTFFLEDSIFSLYKKPETGSPISDSCDSVLSASDKKKDPFSVSSVLTTTQRWDYTVVHRSWHPCTGINIHFQAIIINLSWWNGHDAVPCHSVWII